MRQRQEYQGPDTRTDGDTRNAVCLFEDFAFLDRQRKSFVLGQVIRMVCRGKEYRRPVTFGDPMSKDIIVHVMLYKPCGEVQTCLYSKTLETKTIKHSDIISAINLSVEDTTDYFLMENDDLLRLQNAVSELCPAKPCRQHVKTGNTINLSQRSQNVADDGRRTLLIEPEATPGTSTGSRRSNRKRTLIVHECS